MIEHGMQQMNPFIGVGLRQPKKLALHRLRRILFEVDQDKEQFVFDGWERAVAIGGVGASDAVIPLNRLSTKGVRKAGCKDGDEVVKLSAREAGQGDEFGLVVGDILVPEHRASFSSIACIRSIHQP